MRYRRQDANGDYVFGNSKADFYVNEPAVFAQAVKTRLRLFLGEYFVDTTVGMPWQAQVLGFNTENVYDGAVRNCIKETPGFLSFVRYSSSLERSTRMLTIDAVVNSVYSNQVHISHKVPAGLGYGEGGYGENAYGGTAAF
jgi:hypothetical protein